MLICEIEMQALFKIQATSGKSDFEKIKWCAVLFGNVLPKTARIVTLLHQEDEGSDLMFSSSLTQY